MKKVIQTESAPKAIGAYSQAVQIGNTVYVSGQIGINPATMEMEKGIESQTHMVFQNLSAVIAAAGGRLSHAVKLNVYLADIAYFAAVNEIMTLYFDPPYPARAAVGVVSLPRSALIEIDAIAVLEE